MRLPSPPGQFMQLAAMLSLAARLAICHTKVDDPGFCGDRGRAPILDLLMLQYCCGIPMEKQQKAFWFISFN